MELKQARNTGDGPLMAFVEVLCYGLQAIRCKNELLSELQKIPAVRSEITAKSFDKTRLIIAAPDVYWKNWRKADEVKRDFDVLIKVKEDLEVLKDAINYSDKLKEKDARFEIDCVSLISQHLRID